MHRLCSLLILLSLPGHSANPPALVAGSDQGRVAGTGVYTQTDEPRAGGLLSAALEETTPSTDRARNLMEELSPEQLEQLLANDPDLTPGVLAIFSGALAVAEPSLHTRLATFVGACARARGRRLARDSESWTGTDIDLLLSLQVLDRVRFARDPAFRESILEILPSALDPEVPEKLRDRLLYQINQLEGVDFATSERIEWAWRAIARRSLEREVPYRQEEVDFPDDLQGPVSASVYSLSSSFFGAEEVGDFLTALRRHSPARSVVVLSDLPLREKLQRMARQLGIHLVETYGRRYTPWPRDPLSLARHRDGGVLVLLRPNTQRQRQEDAFLGLELVQNLPPDLDREWNNVRWTVAPVPFHNGQVLFAGNRAWISLHTVEIRILQLLGVDRVPVHSFQTQAGMQAYFGAARQAAAELEALYRRPVRFVHPLADSVSEETSLETLQRIGGGAGYDLDSLLTFVPQADGGPVRALVGDIHSGLELLERLSGSDWRGFRGAYDFAPEPWQLAQGLREAQSSSRAQRLATFLDLIAAHLDRQALEVHRLPLVLVPTLLLQDGEGFEHPDFLITWNNVVVESGPEGVRAEGFSSLLEPGDRLARRTYARVGCNLELLPSLVTSVVLNGGYRCASNHLRRTSDSPLAMSSEKTLPAGSLTDAPRLVVR